MNRPLTASFRPGVEPPDINEYEKGGGYRAVSKALRTLSPREVTQLVEEAGLRGRGGAGFPTGKKWSFVPMGDDAPRPKYLVANADEMEPDSFKDRFLLEGNPHPLVEGVILAAYAIQAEVGYIFLRAAYHRVEKFLKRAIAEARDGGYIGKNILGTDFSLDLRLHISAGRYMCGEETALLNSLEGRRAQPRTKPPYPQVVGLWGQPTVVQNVETLCNVPHIVNNGAQWFKGLSRTSDGGTKIYGVSGRVKRTGAWELPMGTPLREILEDHAQGMREGFRLRGLLPGGGSTAFLTEEHLDVPMDFDSVQKAGSRLGTGTIAVLDDRTCPVAFVANLEHFFAHESCGWCTPCREGLPWTEKMLVAIEKGRGCAEDLEQLELNTKFLGPGMTFCALAPGAMDPLRSALKYFRADFERHIEDKACPWSK